MLLPQFSIRTMFALTAIAAVASLVLQQATVGATWAYAVCATFAYLLFLFGAFAGLFLLCFTAGRVLGIVQRRGPLSVAAGSGTTLASPFAAEFTSASPFAAEAAPTPSLAPNEVVAEVVEPTNERPG